MARLLSSPSHLFLHRFLWPPPEHPSSYPFFSLFALKPFASIHIYSSALSLTSSSFTSRPLFSPSPSHSLSSNHPPHSLCTSQLTLRSKFEDQFDDVENENDDFESAVEEEEEEEEEEVEEEVVDRPAKVHPLASARSKEPNGKLPSLTVKEKKELASYAHSLGKKLKSQQVGKSGVTDSVATALIETLEANELLKIKIHNNCPGELEDAVKQLEESTGSVVVGKIGRTVILYRPSPTKLKAEEKKKEAQRIFRRKQLAFKSAFEGKFQNRRQEPRASGRGRRGSSRFSSS